MVKKFDHHGTLGDGHQSMNPWGTFLSSTYLVGGLVAIFYFPINIGFMSSSQLTHIFQRGGYTGPPTRYILHRFCDGWPYSVDASWPWHLRHVRVGSGTPHSPITQVVTCRTLWQLQALGALVRLFPWNIAASHTTFRPTVKWCLLLFRLKGGKHVWTEAMCQNFQKTWMTSLANWLWSDISKMQRNLDQSAAGFVLQSGQNQTCNISCYMFNMYVYNCVYIYIHTVHIRLCHIILDWIIFDFIRLYWTLLDCILDCIRFYYYD